MARIGFPRACRPAQNINVGFNGTAPVGAASAMAAALLVAQEATRRIPAVALDLL